MLRATRACRDFFSLLNTLPTLQLREVLEKFLDDDSDMKDLNLTAKVGPTGLAAAPELWLL
jgi:hypothetical protein